MHYLQNIASTIQAIKDNQLKPSQLVEACIANINRFNPKLNAIIDSQLNQARQQAKEYDHKKPEPHQTLFGIPCTIKEAICVEGLSHTVGMIGYKGRKASEDA